MFRSSTELPAAGRRGWPAYGILFLGLLFARSEAADITINISAAPGLKFEPARFVVAPGDKVTLLFKNPDDMMHNLVVTRPGARMKVVEGALALGADGPARNFVPATDLVLWSTAVVNPAGSTQLSFTAPREEGVYPYVCTFPGHGLVMFGAMYVGKNVALPALVDDPHLPIVAAATNLHARLEHPTIQRTFLPDSGPATIAVGLPGGQSYCFDAAQCRLRYAWRGGFVDHSPQWLGKGDQFASVTGRIYYRAPESARLRVGSRETPPKTKWLGYSMGKTGPALEYMLDGAKVIERPRELPGGGGLEFAFEMTNASGPVTFVADASGGATITASRGKWSGNRLTLTPAEAREFTLTLTERPGVEALGYWSMNDALFTARTDPPPGVKGRAFVPGGTGNKREVLDSGIAWSALQHGGTLMSWVKLDAGAAGGKAKPVPIFSTGSGTGALRVIAPVRDSEWHHITVVAHHGSAVMYIDGREQGAVDLGGATSTENIQIGSAGREVFFPGLMDEVRIFDRPLSAAEIGAIHQRENPTAVKGRPAS